MVTYGGEQSLDRYLALSARGLPFNVAHAVGNVVLALAAGPGAGADDLALPRAASSSPGARPAALPLVLCRAALAAGARRAAPRRRDRRGEVERRLGWLERRRTPTAASAPRRAQPSSPAMTGWAMLGLEAAGRNPLDVRARRRDADRLPARARPAGCGRPATSSARSSRSRAPGSTRAASAATTWSRELRRRRDGDGSFDGQVNLTAFVMRSPCAPPAPTGARWRAPAAWLRRAQNGDGGWGIQPQAAERRRLDRRRAAGAGRGGRAAAARRRAAPRYLRKRPAPATAASRSAASGVDQRAVDRLGGPGPRRRRRRARPRGRRRHSPTSATGRPPTATTATRPRATRRRSGSPRQALLAVERKPFPLAGGRARRARERRRSGGSTATGAGGRSGAGQPASQRRSSAAPSSSSGSVGRLAAAARREAPAEPRRDAGAAPDAERAIRGRSARPTAATAAPGATAAAALAATSRRAPTTARPPVSVAVRAGARRLDGAYLLVGVGRAGAAGRRRPTLWYRRRAARERGPPRYGCRRWTSRPRSAPGAPTRRIGREPVRPRDARRAARAGALGAEPPPDQPVALPGARARRRSRG